MPGLLTQAALRGALLFPLIVPALTSAAHADVYHAVAAGETIATVAAKYRISTDQLRTANNLADADSAPLGAMLLRVPTSDNKTYVSNAKNLAPAPTTATFGSSLGSSETGNGTITKTLVETVRAGDTWETIADRYRAAGHEVTVQSLRARNNWSDIPAVGATVIVPLGQTSYSAPARNYAPRPAVAPIRPVVTASAQTTPSAAAMRNAPAITVPRNLGGGVVASGEMDLPFAQDNTPTKPPVFAASAPSAPKKSSKALQ
ncbi:LysM peptidoglycan-binding domain-containing protein [bacterium]|nr:MAG: LysM peptidoglycan-binding domain-containing protein [bacterium]